MPIFFSAGGVNAWAGVLLPFIMVGIAYIKTIDFNRNYCAEHKYMNMSPPPNSELATALLILIVFLLHIFKRGGRFHVGSSVCIPFPFPFPIPTPCYHSSFTFSIPIPRFHFPFPLPATTPHSHSSFPFPIPTPHSHSHSLFPFLVPIPRSYFLFSLVFPNSLFLV